MAAKLAVVGSGVSGLTAAYLLARSEPRRQVTLFEAESRLGGHAHTHLLKAGTALVGVDSGFIVHNDRTYPHLRRLFAELQVGTQPCEMSMSVRDPSSGMEYAGGRGMRGFVARPRQLVDLDYLVMLAHVKRFHRVASQFLATTTDEDTVSYGEFLKSHAFSETFLRWYAVPLVSCVWSTDSGDALSYPARYLFRFLAHHGMLSIGDSPQWLTVTGGSARYVDAVAARVSDVRPGLPVRGIRRTPDGVQLAHDHGVEDFAGLVIATPPDVALGLLQDPTPAESEVLGAFRQTHNTAILHTDARLLPRARAARASWNFQVPPVGVNRAPVVTYWMNRLQRLPQRQPLLVSLNAEDQIDPTRVLKRMEYRHPIYDLAAVRAQRRLPEITSATTAYAGAWLGWGFHEDGCRSGVEAAAAFGAHWETTLQPGSPQQLSAGAGSRVSP